MKILFIHTYYNQKGGEDVIFEQDYKLLSKHHEVIVSRFQNKDGVSGALQFLSSIWNISAARKIKKIIKNTQPDVVHIHNTHFACGPIILRTINKAGIPIVVTLHNFRLLCPSATLLHNNKLFTDSIHKKFPWRAIKNKVYRNSVLQTFWLAFIYWFHKVIGTWNMCQKFLVQTNFTKNIFTKSRTTIQADKYIVQPNCMAAADTHNNKRANHFLFIGRLSEEKGIKHLLNVFENSPYELRIGGAGPLQELVQSASLKNNRIKYLGKLDKENVLNELKTCTALIFPSIWYEGMPMTILEAFSTGTTVIASNYGAMAEMISHNSTGFLFEKGNEKELELQMDKWLSASETTKLKISDNILKDYAEKYTSEKYSDSLQSIYRDILFTKNEKSYKTDRAYSTRVAYNYR